MRIISHAVLYGGFWDWNRWQREIDFLALSGFTHALVTAGLEKTWEDFLIGLGYPRERLFRFIPNPLLPPGGIWATWKDTEDR